MQTTQRAQDLLRRAPDPKEIKAVCEDVTHADQSIDKLLARRRVRPTQGRILGAAADGQLVRQTAHVHDNCQKKT